MKLYWVLKIIMVFVAGILSTLVVLYLVNTRDVQKVPEGKLRGERSEDVKSFSTEDKVYENSAGIIQSVSDFVQKQVKAIIDNNSVISPVRQTTQDVQKAIESVTSLPDQQRKAICAQICSE